MNKVGAVAYTFQYSMGMLSYQKREGARDTLADFIRKTHDAGGEAVQIYNNQIDDMDKSQLRELRSLADSLGVTIEVHGGSGYRESFEHTMDQALELGSPVIGIIFGMMPRPDKAPERKDWEEYSNRATKRFMEVLPLAEKRKLRMGMENHLDFTVDELTAFLKKAGSEYAGVFYDVGNSFGTVEDPIYASEQLAPYVFATHVKDWVVEETARGFRLTMVPLGDGNMLLKDVMRPVIKAARPEMNICIEIISGQQLDINWVESRFWTAFDPGSCRQIADVLRHIRSKGINMDEFKSLGEVNALSHDAHMQIEFDRFRDSTAYLKNILKELETE